MGYFMAPGELGRVEFMRPSKKTKIIAAWADGNDLYLRTSSNRMVYCRIASGFHKKVCRATSLHDTHYARAMAELGFIDKKEYNEHIERWKREAAADEIKHDTQSFKRLVKKIGKKEAAKLLKDLS